MNNVANTDLVSAPHSYEDMHRTYFPYIVSLCSVNGIDENNKEDVASEIFLRLMERRFLDQFDPTLVFEYQGQKRPARFKSFLSSVVVTYVRGHYDKQMRLKRREPQLIDTPNRPAGNADPGGLPGDGRPWIEVHGPEHPDHADAVLDKILEEDNADAVRAFLADIPPRSSHDRCDLVALYTAVREQILEFGVYDIKKLTELFAISSTAMHTWMWWLKANLAELYDLPLPPKRPRNLKAA